MFSLCVSVGLVFFLYLNISTNSFSLSSYITCLTSKLFPIVEAVMSPLLARKCEIHSQRIGKYLFVFDSELSTVS